MQSHQDSFGAEASKRYGHRRTPTLGKAMPVTSLLLHCPPPTVSTLHSSCTRDGRTPDDERPPLYFQLETTGTALQQLESVTPREVIAIQDEDMHSSCDEINLEQEYELLVSECSSDNGDGDRSRNESGISLVGNSIFYTPCLTCTDNAPGDLGARTTAINEMCRRLCTDECRLRLSLAGFEPPSTVTLKSKEALAEYVRETCLKQRPPLQHNCSEETIQDHPVGKRNTQEMDEVDQVVRVTEEPVHLDTNMLTSTITSKTIATRPPSCIAIHRKQFLTDLLGANATDTDSDSNFADEETENTGHAVVDEDKEKLGDVSKIFQFVANLVAPTRELADGTTAVDTNHVGGRDNSADDANVPTIDRHEMAMLKDFRDRFEIAEALAKTSAMTSTPQIKQRLAARKLEMANANANAKAAANASGGAVADKGECVSPTRQQKQRRRRVQLKKRQQQKHCEQQPPQHGVLASCAPAHDALTRRDDAMSAIGLSNSVIGSNKNEKNNTNDDEHQNDDAGSSYNGDSNDDNDDYDNDTDSDNDYGDDFGSVSDIAATKKQQPYRQQNLNEFEPPRDLLLYLVRMGSFNSAPKINNVDSQDDSLEIPKGLSTTELLHHVKHLRGVHQPQLLTRYFVKPSLAGQMVTSDVTDGLRCLKLNTAPRDYSTASTLPNHIRVLQWNILSQTLGQNNDGFVRCPEEALTWENRKFLIVQEILQNNPDIVCLQEVDHFKFLQNILGTQNYEGIFFPKPDSPCLYIEENNGPDGCAIFFKRDKFELKNFNTRVLEVWRVQSNQVAIVANLAVKATGSEFCVCTTHLKARHGSLLSKLRNEQGRDLLRFVKQFAGQRPVLICGDFNAEPTEPVYATVLGCEILKLASAYADIKVERDECNNDSVHLQNGSAVMRFDVEVKADMNNCADKVVKSINCEPPYTTWKIREDGEECHTIDYVFYSPEHFKVKNCLEFPQDDDVGKNRTPSFQYPSDHFSLVCDFEIVDKQ